MAIMSLKDPPSGVSFGTLIYGASETEPPKSPKAVSRNLDWVAVGISKPGYLTANLHPGQAEIHRLLSVSKVYSFSNSETVVSELEVCVMAGGCETYSGLMATTPSFLLLPPGNAFVQAYTMKITSGTSKYLFWRNRSILIRCRSATRRLWNLDNDCGFATSHWYSMRQRW